MKFVQELSFAQQHPMFSHQGLKPVPILNFFALSPQDLPPGKPLQTLGPQAFWDKLLQGKKQLIEEAFEMERPKQRRERMQ